MKFPLFIILSTITAISCQIDLSAFFKNINEVTTAFNSIAAEIAWESSVNPGKSKLSNKAANYQKERIKWEENICGKLAAFESRRLLNGTQMRMAYLMCRGPKFTFDEARKTSALYKKLQFLYSDAEICIPYKRNIRNNYFKEIENAILEYLSTVKTVLKLKTNESVSKAAKIAIDEKGMDTAACLKGESAFEDMMRFSRNQDVLKWLWLVWRGKVGPPIKVPYKELVNVENKAARRNGYIDIGAAWRDELEIPYLRTLCHRLNNQIRPLYSLLHGVVRFYLRKEYGNVVPERGPIPAHLLGNLWSQNWESIADLILPQTIDLDRSIKRSNWTTLELVKHAEDFYLSLGLPAMTDTFWRKSMFKQNNMNSRCHGTAADMFKDRDYRISYCTGTSAKDLYVLHHEMGHIHYFMAYEKQPGIFRQANSALHETIGDSIMYGVMTPQHLYRLGLINDSVLFTSNLRAKEASASNYDEEEMLISDKGLEFNDILNDMFNEKEIFRKEPYFELNGISIKDILLLKQALNKLPQIPFSLVIDEYRWKYFEGGISTDSLNEYFWDLSLKLQGIAPPESRNKEYFDVAAKYHVPDNTPFVRYFLSSFLQHQLFESLCKASVYGHVEVKEDLPDTMSMDRCDIYGSRSAGKLLKNLMSRGHSQHWREILQETIGIDVISASALKRYYQPLRKLLERLVSAHNIPIGW